MDYSCWEEKRIRAKRAREEAQAQLAAAEDAMSAAVAKLDRADRRYSAVLSQAAKIDPASISRPAKEEKTE